MFFRLFILIAISLLPIRVLLVKSALAESLISSNSPKAYHSKKRTSHKFILEEKLPFGDSLPEALKGQSVSNPAYLYSSSSNLLASSGVYDGLSKCKKSRKITQIRSAADDSFRSLDIIVYQFDNKSEIKKAKKFGSKAIPYIEGDLSNPYRDKSNDAQIIIRTLGINCLPTKVKSTSKNGKPAFIFAEGKAAWE